MNEIIEAIKSRISNPILGYFSMALVAINWKSFFYLLVDNNEAIKRIEYFESNTSFASIVAYPLILAITVLIVNKWLAMIVDFLNTAPSDIINKLNLQSEHKQLLLRQQLEEKRREVNLVIEKSIIDRAKIDVEVDEIKNENAREKARQSLDIARSVDSMTPHGNVKTNDKYKILMDVASEYRKRATEANFSNDKDSLINKATEMENKAHSILMNSSEF